MSLGAELEACLEGAAACRAAALVDLDAGLILGMSGETADASGAGEALAAAACELLGRALPPALAGERGGAFDHAVVAGEQALHVFQRLADTPDRALCLTFDPAVAPDAALAHARERQQALAEAGLW
ncbi:MAG: hypothetical protein OEM24_06625 [Paracoccaceae bacterium]|nr:hypothetical protein [Paracoccaceae bacterium]